MFINRKEEIPDTCSIELMVSNVGQRPDSVIAVLAELKREKKKTYLPIFELSLPLRLEEKFPKKLKFDLLTDKTKFLTGIFLTTADKKDVEVNRKWIKGQKKVFL